MPLKPALLCVFFHLIALPAVVAQQAVIRGVVIDSTSQAISDVSVLVSGSAKGTSTDQQGMYRLQLAPGAYTLLLRHVEYESLSVQIRLAAGDTLEQNFMLTPSVKMLEQVEISGQQDLPERREAGLTKIDPQTAQAIPSPFNDFTRILVTLPGVTSNNELSSSYSVRGGNYDENLVYVNDIPVYRPFLVRSGQQEGLSFINPDMVASVLFSAGGWQAKYGDKLSSSLNVTYKEPKQTKAALSGSLLGGAAHLEGATKNQKITYLFGARLKSARYLFNTFEVNGNYLPRFTDVQSYINIDLDGNPNQHKTSLGLLTAFASNRYFVEPESRETTFGTLQQAFRLNVYYDGQETLKYRTFQQGVKLTHRFNNRLSTKLIGSWVNTQEREYYELWGAYRLSEVALGEDGRQVPQQESLVLGIGQNYEYARNKLLANIFNAESRTAFAFNKNNTLEFGAGYSRELINDRLKQYDFSDSAGYATIHSSIISQLELNSHRFFAFAQNTFEPSDAHTLTVGVRTNYWSVNGQWLISPRVQYAFKPRGLRDVVFRLATGLYQQPPFYRELRDPNGNLNLNIKAQSSAHIIAGTDYRFEMFGREFSFLSELYYKYMYNVIPYDVDNVRIRYFANNNAVAYAAGADFRISGEFIPGAESWFSLGILRTRENVEGDGRGYIRRPTDQLINLGIFFQDHLPNDPSSRFYLSLLYGTGLPFWPPEQQRKRNYIPGADYKRVDLGFSKQLLFREDKTEENSFLRSLWLGVEMLNALGADNIISYTWISDVYGQQYAVPNRLSARFFNLKVTVRY